MGFFSGLCGLVGGALSALGSAVCSVGSALGSAIGCAVSAIGGALSSVLQSSMLLQKLLPMLAVVIPPPLDMIAVVAVEVLSATLGKPEKPEELGWQMNKAEKKPDDFDSFDEYKEYLDREYPFDRDAFDAQTDEQKMANRYIGIAGTMQELKEAKDFELNPQSLGTLCGMASRLGWNETTIRDFTHGMASSLGSPSLSALEGALADGLKAGNVSDSLNAVKTAFAEASAQVDEGMAIARPVLEGNEE